MLLRFLQCCCRQQLRSGAVPWVNLALRTLGLVVATFYFLSFCLSPSSFLLFLSLRYSLSAVSIYVGFPKAPSGSHHHRFTSHELVGSESRASAVSRSQPLFLMDIAPLIREDRFDAQCLKTLSRRGNGGYPSCASPVRVSL